MATTDLGACEWFVWDLRRSNLIDRGQLDQVVGEFLKKQPRAEPPALAEYLVGQGILTQFQSDRILQGKTQGLVLGPYTLMDAIGSGSMGTVYKAFSKTDSKWYAVKVLPRRSMWNVRLARRQVRQFEQFNHPSVVPFVDVGTSGGLHYLAWPLVEGESMDKYIEREGKLAPEVAALYALQVATGLSACHQHGIFHGLLKPSNLMLGSDGQPARMLGVHLDITDRKRLEGQLIQSEKLAALGIATIGELAQANPLLLQAHFGRAYGKWMHEAAHGTLFRSRWCNDVLTDWLCARPVWSRTTRGPTPGCCARWSYEKAVARAIAWSAW